MTEKNYVPTVQNIDLKAGVNEKTLRLGKSDKEFLEVLAWLKAVQDNNLNLDNRFIFVKGNKV
jgi:hypothetical protein